MEPVVGPFFGPSCSCPMVFLVFPMCVPMFSYGFPMCFPMSLLFCPMFLFFPKVFAKCAVS